MKMNQMNNYNGMNLNLNSLFNFNRTKFKDNRKHIKRMNVIQFIDKDVNNNNDNHAHHHHHHNRPQFHQLIQSNNLNPFNPCDLNTITSNSITTTTKTKFSMIQFKVNNDDDKSIFDDHHNPSNVCQKQSCDQNDSNELKSNTIDLNLIEIKNRLMISNRKLAIHHNSNLINSSQQNNVIVRQCKYKYYYHHQKQQLQQQQQQHRFKSLSMMIIISIIFILSNLSQLNSQVLAENHNNNKLSLNNNNDSAHLNNRTSTSSSSSSSLSSNIFGSYIFDPHVQAHCERNLMNIIVTFDHSFNGIVHVRNFRRNPCQVYGNGSQIVTLTIDLLASSNRANFCGVHRIKGSEERSISLVVRLHRALELSDDKHFVITCGNTEFSNRNRNEKLIFKFVDRHGHKITKLYHGEPYRLRAEIVSAQQQPQQPQLSSQSLKLQSQSSSSSSSSSYHIYVRNCFIFNSNDTDVEFLNKHGCPNGHNDKLISPFKQIGKNIAEAEIYSMFKLPGTNQLHLQCLIELIENCKFCDQSLCHYYQSNETLSSSSSVMINETNNYDNGSIIALNNEHRKPKSDMQMLASTTVYVFEPDQQMSSSIKLAGIGNGNGGNLDDFIHHSQCNEWRFPWLIALCIMLGILLIIMMVVNIFLCTSMSCSCFRSEMVEHEPTIIDDYDPYKIDISSYYSPYDSRLSLNRSTTSITNHPLTNNNNNNSSNGLVNHNHHPHPHHIGDRSSSYYPSQQQQSHLNMVHNHNNHPHHHHHHQQQQQNTSHHIHHPSHNLNKPISSISSAYSPSTTDNTNNTSRTGAKLLNDYNNNHNNKNNVIGNGIKNRNNNKAITSNNNVKIRQQKPSNNNNNNKSSFIPLNSNNNNNNIIYNPYQHSPQSFRSDDFY